MKNRPYLFIAGLACHVCLSLSEAGSTVPGDGAQVGPQIWSVSIPVKNNRTIAQRMVLARPLSNWGDGNAQPGKISENESPRPLDRVILPKKDTTQTPGEKRG